MKKVMNRPGHVVQEMIEGFLAAYPGRYLQTGKNGYSLVRQKLISNKVAIVIGGGSGHEPMFIGFVGDGMADGAAIGNVFISPNPAIILETVKKTESGAGTLFIYGNYAGDVLNFDMAAELASAEQIMTESVRVSDDVASAPREKKSERRGIAGDLFIIKIAGAAAQAGYNLADCKRVADKANDATRSIGIGLTPGTNPVNGKQSFTLDEDEIEFGIGIHGERGIYRAELASAEELTDKMVDLLIKEMPLDAKTELAVCINGLGSTTLMELYIVNKHVHEIVRKQGACIHDTLIGNFCTSQEMGGFSISMMRLDPELKALYDAPAHTPFFTR